MWLKDCYSRQDMKTGVFILELENVIKCSKIINMSITDMPLSWAKYLLSSAPLEAEGCGMWSGVSDV